MLKSISMKTSPNRIRWPRLCLSFDLCNSSMSSSSEVTVLLSSFLSVNNSSNTSLSDSNFWRSASRSSFAFFSLTWRAALSDLNFWISSLTPCFILLCSIRSRLVILLWRCSSRIYIHMAFSDPTAVPPTCTWSLPLCHPLPSFCKLLSLLLPVLFDVEFGNCRWWRYGCWLWRHGACCWPQWCGP